MSQNASLTEYYVKTLLMQYLAKPKANDTIRALVSSLMIFDLIVDVRDGYNVETGIGRQLDILGKYIGISRDIIGFDTDLEYFGYLLYGETPPKAGIGGFLVYGQPPVATRFRRYVDNNTTVYSMTDDQYRVMLQMGIFKNHSNASLESIDVIMETIFGDRYLVDDNGDMFLRYTFQESDKLLVSIARFVGLLPRPTGVGLTVDFVPDIEHVFGFKLYGETAPPEIVGFKLYGIAKSGGMASYG
jgi:hypothetical protein